MSKVAYIGAFNDLSGYADAARNNVCAISKAGYPIDAIPLSFESFETNCGKLGEIIRPLKTSNSNAPMQIIHTIPPVFEKFISLQKYNIGYTAWESDRLPDQWVRHINQLNEVWVPSTYNKTTFENSGIDIPIQVVPHTFNREIFDQETDSSFFARPAGFVFYSIFQFLERKGPMPLLKAYLTEFSKDEDVCLLLKTYIFDPNSPEEREKLKEIINTVKSKLRLRSYPDIYLLACPLSRPQINGLHKACDCLVSSHCSEGFGVTLTEAMMAGNPVIATDHSGSTDFLSAGTGYPVPYQMTPVFNMPWEAYNGHQSWADINVMELRKTMRHVFENQKEARIKGIRGQRFIEENLSWGVVGKQMRQRLEEIHAGIQ